MPDSVFSVSVLKSLSHKHLERVLVTTQGVMSRVRHQNEPGSHVNAMLGLDRIIGCLSTF